MTLLIYYFLQDLNTMKLQKIIFIRKIYVLFQLLFLVSVVVGNKKDLLIQQQPKLTALEGKRLYKVN